MDPMAHRVRAIVLNIQLPDENETEVNKELEQEGKAPMLKKVEKPTHVADGNESMLKEANKFQSMIVNGEDRKLKAKMKRGEKPTGLGERVQMEALKNSVTED